MDFTRFEKPILDLEQQIAELSRRASMQAIDLSEEIRVLENEARQLREVMFAHLTPYQITQLSRHPRRPSSLEVIQQLCNQSFVELHGDRNYRDDPAIVGGLGTIGRFDVMMMGHQKGRGTKENIARNFGMAKPEGYRKALRLMSLAERFRLPIITFIDTPGAYPGIGAEERGQSEAIGKCIMVMARLRVPIICVVIGEGGSGGALALGVGNRVHMLQYSVYSVISPEGCASILMKDVSKAAQMASALQLTAKSAQKLGVIHSIIKEPLGGAHRSLSETTDSIREVLMKDLAELSKLNPDELRQDRLTTFGKMGSEGIIQVHLQQESA